MFIQGNLLRTIAWELTSPMALRNCSKEISEEPGYIGVFVGEQNVVKLQNTTVNYQKKITNISRTSVLFYVWENGSDWAHWNYSFDMHLNYPGPVSSFSPFWIPLKRHCEDSCSDCWFHGRQHSVYWNRRQHFFCLEVRLLVAGIVTVAPKGLYLTKDRVWTHKAEHQRIDAFELRCWRRLLRVPWTARRSNQKLLKEIQLWIFIGNTDAEAEAPILWPPDVKSWLIGKDPDAGKDWRQEEKGEAEDEMVG